MKLLGVLMGLIGVSSFTGVGHAQSEPYFAEPPRAYVSIRSKSATDLRVVPTGSNDAVAECFRRCDFWALPGRYTLYTRDHDSGAQHELGLKVNGWRSYELQQGNDSARGLGLALGVGGAVSIFAGVLLTLPVVMSSMCHDTDCVSDDERMAARIGLGALVAGAVMTPIGWTMFSHNRTRLRPLDELRMGVVGFGQGGVGFGSAARF